MSQEFEPTWCCRVHPIDWWHEVGCPHQEWTVEQLRDALIAKKRGEWERLPDWSFSKTGKIHVLNDYDKK